MTRWEYEIVHVESAVNDVLADYGARGWELVAIAPDGLGFYFKRPFEDSAEPRPGIFHGPRVDK